MQGSIERRAAICTIRVVHTRLQRKEDLEDLPWRALPSAHLSISPLNALRFDLSVEDSELLELRYARELSVEELAFVYAKTPLEMEERVDSARAQAQLILDRHGSRDADRFGRVVIEAFALEAAPRTRSDDHEGIEPLPNGTIVGGRYSIEARVGLGAFGDVYRAKGYRGTGSRSCPEIAAPSCTFEVG